MNVNSITKSITNWLKDYSIKNNIQTLVIGVSGGIDSAVTSAICARTGLNVIALSMPINQIKSLHSLSNKQLNWLKNNFKNVKTHNIDLSNTYLSFNKALIKKYNSDLGFANSKARLRMTTLYQIAASSNGIVVGTGNKVEDFGVGFFTKYGDGGVDISPIADCNKTLVWKIGKYLKIPEQIIDAPPTDGLWNDGRTDEDQLGMTYKELEDAMVNPKNKNYKKYMDIRKNNLHKMRPIPIFKLKGLK